MRTELMRIGITGGSGFVGSYLLRRVAALGGKIRVLSRRAAGEFPPNVEHVEADLLRPDKSALRRFTRDIDVLVHCAGEIRRKDLMEALHVTGTSLLVEAARGSVAHWVQLSSVGAYGHRDDEVVTEKTAEAPSGPYETTKTASDHIVMTAALEGAFALSVLRPSAIIGADMPNQSVRELIRAVRRRSFFFIGPRGATRNYIHVEDVVQALILCAENSPATPEVFNLSNCCTIEDFVSWTCDAIGSPNSFPRIPVGMATLAAKCLSVLPGFPLTLARVRALTGRAVFDISKLKRERAYQHAKPISEAILELVRPEPGARA